VLVVAIVAQATLSFGHELIRGLRVLLLAGAAAALLWMGYSPLIVIAGAAVVGLVIFPGIAATTETRESPLFTGKPVQDDAVSAAPLGRHLLKVAGLLFIPVAAMGLLFLVDRDLFHLATLMLRIDLFAFGGGFASLPLMLHEVVDVQGWLSSNTFMEGIALGQITPGPIVITTTFIGYLTYGLAGAVVGTIAIFTPSFLLVVGLAPFFERLKDSPWFIKATTGILASFVGLLFYVTIKFAIAVPWDAARVLLGTAAFVALLRRVDILYVVVAGAIISLVIFR
jgi:chromate transporter